MGEKKAISYQLRTKNSIENILSELHNPGREYRPISFWFLNHRLEEGEIVRQVREMADKGLGGFMFHGRDGLRSKYLGGEWKDALSAALREAERLGLEVWLYDENHYPSGPAGGRLLEKFPERIMKSLAPVREGYIKYKEQVNIEFSSESVPLFALALPGNTNIELPGEVIDLSSLLARDNFSWCCDVKSGALLIILAEIPWEPIPSHAFPYYPDYLDKEMTEEFIRITHEWYRKHFGRYFGRRIRGIFTDNSCGNFGYIRRSIPWGKDFEEKFKDITGLELRRLLPGLFYGHLPGARRARLIFWDFFGKEYMRSFLEPIKEFCDKNRIYSTGHLCLEDGMGEHVRQIGDYFEVMRNFSLTAVDQLGPRKARGDDLFASQISEDIPACIKNTSSAGYFTGSPRVMCESFGLAGGWDLDLGEIRRISGFLSVLGVDLFVPHGLYYSIAGGRKWEATPDHLHNPMWKYYRQWTDWVSRISYLSSGGRSLAEIALLYPIHTLRAHLEVGQSVSAEEKVTGIPASDRGQTTDFIEQTYYFIIHTLLKDHLNFEIVDEEILNTGKVKDGCLLIDAPGKEKPCVFKLLILPAIEVIEPETLRLLEKFMNCGGVVLMVNKTPSLIYRKVGYEVEEIAESDTIFTHFPSGWDFTSKSPGVVHEESLEKEGKAVFIRAWPAKGNVETEDFLTEKIQDYVEPHISIKNIHSRKLLERVWEKWSLKFYLVANITCDIVADVEIEIKDSGLLWRIDLSTGLLHEIGTLHQKTGQIRFRTDFSAGDAAIFVLVPKNCKAELSSIQSTIKPFSLALKNSERDNKKYRKIEIGKEWRCSLDRPNVFVLRNWEVQVRDSAHILNFRFESEGEIPCARLLIDQERSTPEFEAHRFGAQFRCFLNGREISEFVPGSYLDRNIYEAEVRDVIKKGENLLQIHSCAGLLEWEYRMWPPMLIGNFAVKKKGEEYYLTSLSGYLKTGFWVEQGLPFFAGEAIYSQHIRFPEDVAGHHILLDLGNIANLCKVEASGNFVGQRIAPPWQFDLTEFVKGGSIELKISVTNTAHNLFCQDLKPAGLLGPVTMYRI